MCHSCYTCTPGMDFNLWNPHAAMQYLLLQSLKWAGKGDTVTRRARPPPGFLWIQLCWWPRSLLQPDPPWPAAGGHQPLQSAENCLRLSTGTRQGLTEPPAGLWSNLVSGAMKQKMEQQHNPSPLSKGDNNPQQGHSHILNASCLSAEPMCLPPLSLTNMAFRWYKWFLFWRTECSQNKRARGWIERFPPGPVLVR